MKINISIIKGILKSLSNNGVDIKQFTVFNSDDLFAPRKDSDQLIDATLLFKLISEIRSLHKDLPSFYSLFNYLHVLDMGLLGHYLLSCKNIFSAYEKLIAYQLLFSNFIEFKYRNDQENILWSLQMPYQLYGDKYNMESLSDFELFFRLKIVETLSTTPLFPFKIDLFYYDDNSNERKAFFENQFNCEVNYTRRHNVLHYKIEDLNRDIHFQNYTLYNSLNPIIKSMIVSQYQNKTYKNTIKSILLNNVEMFPVSIDFVAQKLLLSVRKLQQILKEENTSFSKILTEVKMILGIDYLSHGKKVKEIADKLGYKEQGSFTRQFKQITGMNPAQFSYLNNEQKAKAIRMLSE